MGVGESETPEDRREDAMRTVVVRYETKPDRADENQRLVEKVFAELAERQPDNFRYAAFRLDDGVSFVHLAMTDTVDGKSPLSRVKAFKAFQRDIDDRCEEAPVVTDLREIGSFRLFEGGA
jgi:hypothetical protein